MKKLLTVFFCALKTLSCHKSSDPMPVADAGSTISGSYAISHIRLDSAGIALYEYTLPATQGATTLSGQIVARKDSISVVFLTEVIKLTGRSDQQTVIGQVKLKPNGSIYDMFINKVKIGTADGKIINIDEQQARPQTGTIYRSHLTAQKI